ncbi:unnamed protein product [Paramecium pentaurelia]|uniref:BZIP domain-containing protein n=1 Tax=Paramecium pentaurelia TaxID=43138 RepID=A0A8S1Y597_9CILI|nr:unnamed protein product [Paramecium pentaurelia]
MTDDFFNLDFEVIAINHVHINSIVIEIVACHLIILIKKKQRQRRKKIDKKYEPINENNLYKKITKKLQNREQANRVRGRQKNYGQDMEQKLLDKKKEITLNVIAKLQAEKVVLKQQVEFMQNYVITNTSEDSPKNSYLSTVTAFSIILGFALLNGVGLENQQMIQSFQFQSQSLILLNPFIWFTHSSLARLYSLSCPLSVFKKQIKKEKCYLIILQYTHMNLIENNYRSQYAIFTWVDKYIFNSENRIYCEQLRNLISSI